jgi:hypothetical protein
MTLGLVATITQEPILPFGSFKRFADGRFTAFNAALAIFGSLLVPVDDSAVGPASMSDRIERTRQYLDKAIEALAPLDAGNHLLNRCIGYLRQLAMLANDWSKLPRPISRPKPCAFTQASNTFVCVTSFPFSERHARSEWPVVAAPTPSTSPSR